ncbi:DUF3667 domain-containing protein [uncultured Pontibacter sp.]|uniref:DUF3667 domain-containing protein n=1 Tax=uncultured Pontibacter sp. TaxID=453356 RepID=UPI002603EC2F|nr:DUF3667 domain-containing protein [uncultured Pontibacter sp.]
MATKRRKFTQCPNCGYTLEEVNNFCPNCGQENHNLNVPVKHLVAEFFEGTMHFDTKAWRTLKYLILKPGLLTEKFNIGQRASYVPPFRLYVFVSLIFFFVLALTAKNSVNIHREANTQQVAPGTTNQTDTLALKQIQLEQDNAREALKDLQTNIDDEAFTAAFQAKFGKFTSQGDESKQKLFKNLSFMMFLLMPFFGLLLHLFYRRQKRNYVEHLMFSIHLHTFYFILLAVAMLLGVMLPNLDLGNIVLFIMALYLYFALHQVYKQSYLKTLLSLIPISIIYLVTLGIFFLGTVFVSVLLT